MSDWRALRPALPILVGAAIMLTLSMGIRQTFGLFLQPVTRDIALTVSDFTLAFSIQNLVWGLVQPLAGALVVYLGFRPVLVGGALFYLAGLLTLAAAQGLFGFLAGAGGLIGLALACTASAMAQATAARVVATQVRSLVLGIITGAGTLGALVAAPVAQVVMADHGWRSGMLALFGFALLMLPAAWFAGRVDRVPVPRATGGEIADVTVAAAVRAAFTRAPFVV